MDELHLGVDMALDDDLVAVPTGDIATVSGRKCLSQDLLHALTTPRGDLWCHPTYGIDIYKYLHLEGTAINRLELVQDVVRVIRKDPRVVPNSVKAKVISWDLHKIKVSASCQPVTGGNRLNLVIGYGINSVTGEVSDGL